MNILLILSYEITFLFIISLILLHEHLHYRMILKLGYNTTHNKLKKNFMSCSLSTPQNFISYNDLVKISFSPYPICILYTSIFGIIYNIIFNSYSGFVLILLSIPLGIDLKNIIEYSKWFKNHKKYLELMENH